MSDSTELVKFDIEGPASMPGSSDFRAMALCLPPAQMQLAMQEYLDRRQTFRAWLLLQLKSGVHYGYPPGTEPKFNDNGDMMAWSKGGMKVVPKEQWQAKPSLYLAGADLIVDLLGARDEYSADLDAWKMAGEPKGTFIYACKLYARADGSLLGEGRGGHSIGDRKDANAAVKLAKKCAKVDAVKNAWGLSDLFTQDLENGAGQPPKHTNPNPNPDAPTAPPRSERVTSGEIKKLLDAWTKLRLECEQDITPEKFMAWIAGTTNRNFNSRSATEWTRADLAACRLAIDNMEVLDPKGGSL